MVMEIGERFLFEKKSKKISFIRNIYFDFRKIKGIPSADPPYKSSQLSHFGKKFFSSPLLGMPWFLFHLSFLVIFYFSFDFIHCLFTFFKDPTSFPSDLAKEKEEIDVQKTLERVEKEKKKMEKEIEGDERKMHHLKGMIAQVFCVIEFEFDQLPLIAFSKYLLIQPIH